MQEDPFDIVTVLSDEIARHEYWQIAFERAVRRAMNQAPIPMKKNNITSLNGFYEYLKNLLACVPVENGKASEVLERLMLIHFVFNQKPIYNLQTAIHPSTTREPLSWLSQWMVVYAKCLGLFLDTRESLTQASLKTFRESPQYHLEDYLEPEGGWKNFNEFFARRIKPELRPITQKEMPNVVVSPVDAIFAGSWPVDDQGWVTFKGIPWQISELLQHSEYADQFDGGTFMHFFLTTTNYHRQHAPTSGKVLEERIIQGQVFMDVTAGGEPLKIHRRRKESGSSMVPIDGEGFQWCQTRGLVVLQTPVGLVAVLPIGMSQVSSVVHTVSEGDELCKGDEMSFFQFGGSDVALVFQESSQVEMCVEKNQPLKMGQKLGESMV